MRLKVAEKPLFGKEVYHISSIGLCKKFANECKAFNADMAGCLGKEYKEDTCFILSARSGRV